MLAEDIRNIKPSPNGQILIAVASMFWCEERHLAHPRIVWWRHPTPDSEEFSWLDAFDIKQVIVSGVALTKKRQGELVSRFLDRGICNVHLVGTFNAVLNWVDQIPCDYEESVESAEARFKFYLTGKTGKEHDMSENEASGDKPVKTILVVGGRVGEFPEAMRRDPRVAHWGVNDIHDGIVIPGEVNKVISDFHVIGKFKTKAVSQALKEARDKGRTVGSWDVPNQGRLRTVLAEQLAIITVVPVDVPLVSSNGANDGGDASVPPTKPPVVEDVVEVPGRGLVEFLKAAADGAAPLPGAVSGEGAPQEFAPEPKPDVSGSGEGDVVQNQDHEGDMTEKPTVAEVVRQNMEATDGDTQALFKIARRQCDRDLTDKVIMGRIYPARKAYLDRKATAGTKADKPDESAKQPEGGTEANAATAPVVLSLAERQKAAMAKIEEGLKELRTCAEEVTAIESRLVVLEPFELALKQVQKKK